MADTTQADASRNRVIDQGDGTLIPVVSAGGISAYFGAGGTVTGLVLKTGAGRLQKVVVTTVGTGAATFYDNTAASGNVLFTVPASAAVGTVYTLELPFVTGLFYAGGANQPVLTVSYN